MFKLYYVLTLLVSYVLVDGTVINFIEVQVEFIVHKPLVCKARLV